MIVIMRKDATEEAVKEVASRLAANSLGVHVSRLNGKPIIIAEHGKN